MTLRIVFMGTAELACFSLKALAGDSRFNVIAVVTQPDRPKGRQLRLLPSPVKQTALELDLPVLQPQRARSPEFLQELKSLQPDLIVVAAYGQILPQALLDLPSFGCLNVHTSLLPKYRGAAPIQWAILDGESETGVTIMKMDSGLDTGDILTQETTPISATDNSQTLHDRLARMGAQLLSDTIPAYVSGGITPRKQPAQDASYARKISREDGRIDWQQPAEVIWRRIRAFTPWPGAFAFQENKTEKRLLKIWEAEPVPSNSGAVPGIILEADKSGIVVACGSDAVRILALQREGGRRLSAGEFLMGMKLSAGEKLT